MNPASELCKADIQIADIIYIAYKSEQTMVSVLPKLVKMWSSGQIII